MLAGWARVGMKDMAAPAGLRHPSMGRALAVTLLALGLAACRQTARQPEPDARVSELAATARYLSTANAGLSGTGEPAQSVTSTPWPATTALPVLSPTPTAWTSRSCEPTVGQTGALAVTEQLGLLAVGPWLMAFEMPPTADLKWFSCLQFRTRITALHQEDGIAFVGTEQGLDIVDIHAPRAPIVLGSMKLAAPVERMSLESGTLNLVTQSHSVHLIDVSDPTQPVELAFWDYRVVLRYLGLAPQGRFLSLVSRFPPLQVVDFDDPQAPSLAGSHSFRSPGGDPEAFGIGKRAAMMSYYASLSGQPGGSLLFDLSNPPGAAIYRTSLRGFAEIGVDADAGYAYVTRGLGDLTILRLLSGGRTSEVWSMRPEEWPSGDFTFSGRTQVQVVSGLAFVVSDSGHLQVMDVHAPASPQPLTQFGFPP